MGNCRAKKKAFSVQLYNYGPGEKSQQCNPFSFIPVGSRPVLTRRNKKRTNCTEPLMQVINRNWQRRTTGGPNRPPAFCKPTRGRPTSSSAGMSPKTFMIELAASTFGFVPRARFVVGCGSAALEIKTDESGSFDDVRT